LRLPRDDNDQRQAKPGGSFKEREKSAFFKTDKTIIEQNERALKGGRQERSILGTGDRTAYRLIIENREEKEGEH